MEVHHHAHKPKNWKEYITEFIMLFAAVTLGFFAENLREHTIVKEKIEKNKIAIINDLKQDAITIDSIFVHENMIINRFDRVQNVLFLYKKNIINEKQLFDSISTLPILVAGTSTLYMNNSSFKNMQSSGLLSNLEDNELKSKLSYYYEVIFKRIESNNNFFDQAGINYNNFYLLGIGAFLRENWLEKNDSTTKNVNDYTNFMLNLNKTKNIIKSDEFIYELQKYYNYIFIYRFALIKAKEENGKLLKLMEEKIQNNH